MTDHESLICKALAAARYCSPETAAKNVIAALDAKGLGIFPLEPTEAMVATALEHEYSRQPLPSDVEFVYRAMLAAYGGDDGKAG